MSGIWADLVLPMIGAAVIGAIFTWLLIRAGGSSSMSEAADGEVSGLRKQLASKTAEADGFKARAAEFRALLSKRDAMVAERDNYLAELEGRLRSTEAEVMSLRMSGGPSAGRGGLSTVVEREVVVVEEIDDPIFEEPEPSGQVEVIDLRAGDPPTEPVPVVRTSRGRPADPSTLDDDDDAPRRVRRRGRGEGAREPRAAASNAATARSSGGSTSTVEGAVVAPVPAISDDTDEVLESVTRTAAPPLPASASGPGVSVDSGANVSGSDATDDDTPPAPSADDTVQLLASSRPAAKAAPASGRARAKAKAAGTRKPAATGGANARKTAAKPPAAKSAAAKPSEAKPTASSPASARAATPTRTAAAGASGGSAAKATAKADQSRPSARASRSGSTADEGTNSSKTSSAAKAGNGNRKTRKPAATGGAKSTDGSAAPKEAPARRRTRRSADDTNEQSVLALSDTDADTAVVERAEVDDLIDVVGIGPALAKSLSERGITSFRQLGTLTRREERELDQSLGSFRGRVQREKWVSQARALYEQKYGEKLTAPRE